MIQKLKINTMKTNHLKVVAIFAFAWTSLVACEKSEMVVPQELSSPTSAGKKKSIMDGDALSLDPEIASEPDTPIKVKGKKIITHFHDAAFEELQEGTSDTPKFEDGLNPEQGKIRNRNHEDEKEGRIKIVNRNPANPGLNHPILHHANPK